MAEADDLYKVRVRDAADTQRLRAVGVEPLVRLTDGYLVLADEAAARRLLLTQLKWALIISEVSTGDLAFDGRLDRANVGLFPLVFEQDNLRLYRVDQTESAADLESHQLIPVNRSRPAIEFAEAPQLRESAVTTAADLATLIAGVERDSLESYLERLQAFFRRYTATDSIYAARDWIAGKFAEFEYDSVVFDNFQTSLGESQNVIAYKVGSTWPNQQIVIGAHYDAVSTSPGADDNGTGTAGVLEIARVLQDVETEMTFIFILFAAEEQGLYGSYHYADEAAARGDSIIYMLNMDMIGHYENTVMASLYHGPDVTFSELWQALADSLVGLVGVLEGNSVGSDHWPFSQKGYPVTFVAENIFSSVYHTYRDSTTYVDYDYMTNMVKASLATAYQVNVLAVPQPTIIFTYPAGVPEIIGPNVVESFPVELTAAWGGAMVHGSGQLFYAVNGGDYTAVPLTEISGNVYEAALPAVGCDNQLVYYLSAEESTNGFITDPGPDDPFRVKIATDMAPVFADEFETSTGWIVSGYVTDGPWERGVPAGGGVRGDPPTDFDGSGSCYLTDNVAGNSDVDGGTTFLISPTFDLTVGDAEIHYAFWYSNNFGDDPFNDVFVASLSNDNGQNWTTVESAGPVERASGGWHEVTFWAADYLPLTNHMKVRFSASDLGSGSVVEAAVDDFSVTYYSCSECDCGVWGDINGDGSINPVDVSFLANFVYKSLDARVQPPVCPVEAGDVDCSAITTPLDVTFLVNLVYKMLGPLPCDPCSM
jgi:hypothetical protein